MTDLNLKITIDLPPEMLAFFRQVMNAFPPGQFMPPAPPESACEPESDKPPLVLDVEKFLGACQKPDDSGSPAGSDINATIDKFRPAPSAPSPEPGRKPSIATETTRSSPPAAEPKPKFEKTWTDERDEQLVRQKLAGMDLGDILSGLNTLPGPEIKSEAACKTRFYSLQTTGYKLPEKPAAAKPVINHNPAPPKASAPVDQAVSYDQARQWAAERGLVGRNDRLDLEKVNAKRRQLGLGIFIVNQGRAAAR